eukprot:TRINITY_DN7505_c0_g1_i6.p2 TRINITY_DN7505_c0_g1~~TRINITY_DN7505_c0_g1_i6.p2  ORF type:complete len:283 (-),score=31.90 TRINITY_DN7505_c0_g1_i6:427-1200(-)
MLLLSGSVSNTRGSGVRPLPVVAYKRGQNGYNSSQKPSVVEMFVASVDDLDDLKQQAQSGYQSEKRLVPPPRAFQAVEQIVKTETEQSAALKAANFSLQAKDKQIESLKRALLERETQLRYTKSELLEARKDLQAKEQSLKEMFEQLSTAANERQELRNQLIASEQELEQRLQEVMSWSEGVEQLNEILESTEVENEKIAAGTLEICPTQSPPTESNTHEVEKQYLDIFHKIYELSEQMVKQAKEDEKRYLQDDSLP